MSPDGEKKPAELTSVITCPECGHQKTETMPTDSCQYFYDCEAVGRFSSPTMVTAASIVPMARYRVRRFRFMAKAAVDEISL